MYRLRFSIAVLALLLVSALASAQSGRMQTPELTVTLVSEQDHWVPGSVQRLGLLLEHAPHWHSYWSNPGDSGLTTTLNVTAIDGVSVGEIEWPHPQRFDLAGIANFGYSERVLLPFPITFAPELAGEQLELHARVTWLVCQEQCIPGSADLAITRPLAPTAQPDAALAADFAAAQARLPRQPALEAQWTHQHGKAEVAIALPDGFNADQPWDVFPRQTAVLNHQVAANAQVSGGRLSWPAGLSDYFTTAPESLDLVLVNGTPPNSRAWQVKAALVAALVPPDTVVSVPAAPPLAETGMHWGWALWFALLGGMVLNLMPCVFPVLTLKALALGGDHHGARHGVLYSIGSVLAFLALAAVLLALRAGGDALGWGFQLQSPWLTGALAYLFFVMGLSLSGLFSIGERWMGVGQTLTEGDSNRAALYTGVLAAVVASPCTAPFMGAALGYALAQPPFVALSVFAALGLGLALPFLLLSLMPGLTRFLPRPGVWMDRVKQGLAFPLYLSAIWLLWVYGEQQGALAMARLLAGAVFLAMALWLVQLPGRAGLLRLLSIGLGVGGGMYALASGAGESEHPQRVETAAHESYSAGRLKDLQDAGTPVLVNMTAAWCITCLANERVALSTDAVRAALEAGGVVYLKGDWTRRDDAITQYLAQFGRTGVPLYVLYPGAGQAPRVLPQLLTESLLLDALGAVSTRAAAP